LKVKNGSLAIGESRDSKEAHSHDAWEPAWIDGRFSCLLICLHCEGEVGLVGTYEVRDERGYANGEEVGGDVRYYKPLYFTDAPRIFDIPDGTPVDVSDEIGRSFQLYWSDTLACANRIRAAIEALLTAQRVNRSVGGRQSRKCRRMLSLHERIELFMETRPELADKLLAIKWIGNAGTHSAIVTADDLLDAYEILGFVLDEIYVRRSVRIGALARAINRRRAPRSKRQTKSR